MLKISRFETSHTRVEARLLARTLPPGAEVLEAGCGRSTRLATHRPRIARLVGVDLDVEAGLQNATLDGFVAADLCGRLPFADSSFDLVYANFVVEHLVEPDIAFQEWRRILRPGGALVLLTSNRANPMLRAAQLLPQRLRVLIKRRGAGVAERDVFPAYYRANTPGLLATALSRARFAAEAIESVATLDRYAGGRHRLGAALRLAERLLPASRRSTIV
ncbi:MAG: class I SAM-dependent methyltransferase, partial [Gaiellales bacterium]